MKKYPHNRQMALNERRLYDRRSAIPASQFLPGTVAHLAERLHYRTSTIIKQFERLGIKGLQPHHFIEQSHWETLQSFIDSHKHSNAEEIYCDGASVESKVVIVQELNNYLLRQLAAQPRLMHDLHPRRFEELVAKLLEDQGCEVTLTKRTRDGGYDLLGRMKSGLADLLFLAECKRYGPESKVGVEVVRNLYGVTELNKANLGLIITTSSFSKDAREEKLRIGPRIDLKEFSDLCDWLSPYKTNNLSQS